MSLLDSLTSGVSALLSFEKGLGVIGNNIANALTTGFKSSTTTYSDNFSNLLQQSSPSPADGQGSNTSASQVGTGVQIAGVTGQFAQGTLSPTGNPANLGISGDGFFVVRDPVNNVNYVTRAGDFRLDDQGYLVTSGGFRVQGLADGSASYDATVVDGVLTYTQTATPPTALGDIKVDFNISIGNGLTNDTGGVFTDAEVEAGKPTLQGFAVDPQGNLVLSLSNGDSFVRGKVLLQNFADPTALVREGNNLFSGLQAAGPEGGIALSGTNNSPGSNGLGRLQSGTIELSNVDLSDQFAQLITTQRAFQAGARIITVSDTILEDVVNLKR
ncbi:MAG: flagellar hook-basal body complex protein [Bryobacteraceae bacterium]